ncbi:flagellin [Magnetospirillum fulvum]|uniref:Flagellin n=1 Tax=Magnetospirillum fulvum TaxID=1082 RepID=A0A1H6JR84_MAGFU|nr:flagellin [Magnetospirillum fulvum]SEH61817.1 flagellin [Magnetospirillum fulvum]
MPVISTNTASNSALRYLNLNSSNQSSTLSKLASGSRITKASDDAAGLAIGTRIQSDVTVLSQASTNASQASSILQTADGGLARIADILQRMKSLSTQSNSGTVTDSERTYIQAEYSELSEEIDGISDSTTYNGNSLLNGTSAFASATSLSSVSTAGMTDAQATDLSAIADGDTITITTTDGTTPTPVTYTIADSYDGTAGTVSLQDIADSINAGDTTTPKAANVRASITTDADGLQSLVLTAAEGDETISTIANGTGNAATALGLINTAGTLVGASTGVDFMVGTSTSDTINVSIAEVTTGSLGSTTLKIGATSVSTQTAAQQASDALDEAIAQVSQARAEIGATMSRFEFRSETISTASENLTSAESVIMDADVAAEKSQLSSDDVKTQAAIAALSQANQMPQNLLSLLKS